MVCTPLTARHRETRRNWAAEHRDWMQRGEREEDEIQFLVQDSWKNHPLTLMIFSTLPLMVYKNKSSMNATLRWDLRFYLFRDWWCRAGRGNAVKTRRVEQAVVSRPLPKNYSSRSYESSLDGAASECNKRFQTVPQAFDRIEVRTVSWPEQQLNGDGFNSSQVIYSQFDLAIHQNDHQARRRFVEWAQNEITVVPDFHKRILFSDEAQFWLNGYVNKQNCRVWSEANPQVYVETPLHPEKLTVWWALWAGGIIGPYFFKNDEGHNVTVDMVIGIEP
ncbi:uncharacterized protein TNCV_3977091 [Trichonephila clavipes]|nr:uncharacterized protein TNCV_3977091 [Trichonephila clavipes]